MTSTGTLRRVAVASRAFETVITRWPSSVRRSLKNARASCSSSTARIFMIYSGMRKVRRPDLQVTQDAQMNRVEINGSSPGRDSPLPAGQIKKHAPEKPVGEPADRLPIQTTCSLGQKATL